MELICCKCKQKTDIDNSYSNNFKNVVCQNCFDKIIKEENKNPIEVLMQILQGE